MVMAIGADEIGQHLGVARVGLGAGHDMALPVAGHRQRVDGVDLIAGGHQGGHPQASVGLDAHHHLGGFPRELGEQLVQGAHGGHALGESALGQHGALFVKDHHVVVDLGPVITNEDQPSSCPSRHGQLRAARESCLDLMDQCSAARHPTCGRFPSRTDGGTV